MKVASLIRLKNTKVAPDTPLLTAWKLLSKRNITLISVVDKYNKLVGVIGEDDLLYRLVPDYCEYFSEFYPSSPDMKDMESSFEREIKLQAQDVMNIKVISINKDDQVFKALSRMMIYKVRVLPVIDSDHKYQGMIVEDDIMVYLFKKHENLIRKRTRSI